MSKRVRGEPLRLELAPDDVVIILRAQGGAPEMVAQELRPGRDGRITVRESFLLGYGLMRLMNNRDWREKVVKKARTEVWQLANEEVSHE
jgi:hypothetical protein